MHPPGVHRSLAIVCAVVWLSPLAPGAARAQPPPASITVHTAELPGGAEGIRRAIGDRRATPPATLIVEMTRRVHGGTSFVARDDPTLARLRAWLRTCEQGPSCGVDGLAPDRVPLPGSPAFWRDAVFDGRVPDGQIVRAILGRRDAAFLYTALLSMREDVRAWFVARPALVKQVLGAGPGALVVAAPHLRLDGGGWQLPGGAPAAPVWTALSGGVRPADGEAWILALAREHDGLLAYALEVVDTLPIAQRDAVLALDGPDEARRIAAGLELLDGVRIAARGWQVRDRPFWRPSYDPAFLLSQLAVAADGGLALPGGRAFWDLVHADGDLVPAPEAVRAAWREGSGLAPGALLQRVWSGDAADQALRYEQALFASRRLAAADADAAADAATALRGYARFPQLLRVLDRLGVDDVRRFAAMVRRAEALARAGGDWRARAAIVRWQAMVSALDHMARLGALEPDEANRALDVLAAPEPASAPRGAQVRALLAAPGIDPGAADLQARPIERALFARLTRSRLGGGRRVAWEGETYRLDVGEAERDRLGRVRGRDALPQLDAALAAFALAEAGAVPADAAKTLEAIVKAVRLDRTAPDDGEFTREARAAAARARQLAARADARDRAAAQAALEDLGDALAAEGLGEIAYALDMGWAEDLPLTALAAFHRHRFEMQSPTGARDASWLSPDPSASRSEAWHVAGSLLGLDDALAAVALRRPSLKPLAAAPSLNTGDRRWLVSTVAAFDRRVFTDEAQAALVARVTRGQERLRAVRDAGAARAAAEAAGTSPLRQALAAWIAEADPASLPGLLSTTEIARLGSDGTPLPAVFDGWGNVQPPVTGRLGAGPLPPLPWERYAGKSARLVSAALPDLQLTLALRLAALDLPAVLVPDLMSSATFELVNLAEPRYADDFDALAEYVRRIDADAIERYLGALTTAGPLRRDGSSGSHTSRSTARAPGGLALTIREPAEGTPVLGSTTIAVELAPAPAAATVVVSVDGRELCRFERGPWSCPWDADGEAQEHHLRVVATLPDGRRLVASRRTRGLDINERVEVSAVQVPVIVTDARGRFVQGLKADAFTLLENGKRQRIDTVIDESLPLELVAAVDISASMEGSMPDVRTAVKGLLGRLRPADTTTLLGFNESVFVLTERESDRALRDLAVDSLVPWGGTAFYDATVRSLDLVSQKAGRRGVVVFSDGDDRHSVGRRDASLRRIEEGQVAVYTVGFGTGTSAQFRDTLTAFAEASGGRAYFPRRVEDLDAAFGSIVEELSHQYILSYVSNAPSDGSWRTLQIKACEGCHVRAREGYRAAER